MKPAAYISKNGVLFKELPPEPMDLEPLYALKELTDDEIADLIKATNDETGFGHIRIFDFVKILLRKARET
jgi:hypothetical protein